MDSKTLNNQLAEQMKKAFFSYLKDDLESNPPKLDNIQIIIEELIDALCKFVPSKVKLHNQIREEIHCDVINQDTMSKIIFGLIKWIEKFQCPVDDKVTQKWRDDFKKCDNCTLYIINFLQEYYSHSEKVYKEVWDARKRLVDGENIIPPERRPIVKGKYGIPESLKTGRK